MKPFEFKLQTSLCLKQKEEDRVKEELQIISSRYQEETRHLMLLAEQSVQLEDRLRKSQEAMVDVVETRLCLDYLPVMRGRIEGQQELVNLARAEMESIRQKLVEIMRKRKVLEKLKERHYTQYQLELTREEQKIIDEMATNGYNRKDAGLNSL